MYINRGEPYWLFDHDAVREIEPESVYVADLAVRVGQGWSDSPVAVFYTPRPRGGYTNKYFGVYQQGGLLAMGRAQKWLICDATSAAEHEWEGLALNDEVIFSRWRRDFRGFSFKGETWVDGGPDYFRSVGNFRACEQVKVVVRDGVLAVA